MNKLILQLRVKSTTTGSKYCNPLQLLTQKNIPIELSGNTGLPAVATVMVRAIGEKVLSCDSAFVKPLDSINNIDVFYFVPIKTV